MAEEIKGGRFVSSGWVFNFFNSGFTEFTSISDSGTSVPNNNDNLAAWIAAGYVLNANSTPFTLDGINSNLGGSGDLAAWIAAGYVLNASNTPFTLDGVNSNI